MHEMSYMIKFINMAEEAAAKQPEARISSISVKVGEMTGVLPEYLEKYFPEAAAGTRCEGASLHIESVPVTVRCNSCGNIYHPCRQNDYRCPECNSIEAEYQNGRELELSSIELA